MTTLRVGIADDHQLVREGFKRILAQDGNIRVLGEFASGGELLSRIEGFDCDVMLLDISMPGAAGTDLISRLRRLRPDLPILVVSMHNDVQIVRCALQAGATGYIDKGCTTDMLITAVRAVAGGIRFIDPCLVDVLISEAPMAPHQQLSPRELEVLRLITAGCSGNEIAQRLHLSPKTVSTHKKRLKQKLDVDNTAALIQYALSNGLACRR